MLLTAERLNKRFGPTNAVSDATFAIKEGEILGLIGPSGCGKTTVARMLTGLIKPDAGAIIYGPRISKPTRDVQIISQNPFEAFNPVRTIAGSLTEPLIIHGLKTGARLRLQRALEDVHMSPDVLERRPDSFSGGQRQRLAICRALLLEPKLLVCDEPTASLDLSVQARVLNLLLELRDRRGLSILFISHNLSVVRAISDRILRMDSGIIKAYE